MATNTQAATGLVFPQDEGEGLTQGDPNDAPDFGLLARVGGYDDYVYEGMAFTYDSGVPDVEISAGIAVIQVDGVTGNTTGKSRDQIYVLDVAAITGADALALTDSATNSIYLVFDKTKDNTIEYQARTSGTPTNDHIKIGEVDTSADTTDEDFNRVRVTTQEARFKKDIKIDDGKRTKNNADVNNAIEMKNHAGIADAGKVQLLGVASDTGYVMVIDRTNGTYGSFELDGVNNAVTEVDDPGSAYTTTEDNDTTVNVYWDGTNSQFELNNETGGSADFSVIYFG